MEKKVKWIDARKMEGWRLAAAIIEMKLGAGFTGAAHNAEISGLVDVRTKRWVAGVVKVRQTRVFGREFETTIVVVDPDSGAETIHTVRAKICKGVKTKRPDRETKPAKPFWRRIANRAFPSRKDSR